MTPGNILSFFPGAKKQMEVLGSTNPADSPIRGMSGWIRGGDRLLRGAEVE